MDGIETVGELIAALEDYHPDTPVRLATQRKWLFECTIAGGGRHRRGQRGRHHRTGPRRGGVWIAEGTQVGYLAPGASDALGWSE